MMTTNIKAWLIVCAAALPNLSAQTRIDVRTQVKSADLSSVGPTKPAQTGAVLPSTCGIGEVFFLTTAPLGTNLMVCASANQWSASGGASLGAQADGTPAGTATILNLVPGSYVTQTLSCVSGTCSYQPDIDTTKIPTNAAVQAGQLAAVITTSVSPTAYTGIMAANDPLAEYAANQQLIWNPGATACAGGAMTLNVDGLGAVPLKQGDGVTNLVPAQCGANSQVALTYDAVNTIFRGAFASASAGAGGSNGQIQYNNAGVLSGFTAGGDCTIVPATGVVTCTETAGVPLGALATRSALVSGDIPNNGASTTGNASTANALAASPSLCAPGMAPIGILPNGNVTGCATAVTTPAYTSGQTSYLNFRQSDPAAGNLLADSNTLNVGWTPQGSTVSSGQSDTSGGPSAWKIAEDTSTTYHSVTQTINNLSVGRDYTLTGWIAPSTGRTWGQITEYPGATGVVSSFINQSTCTAGSIGTGKTLTVTTSTNGYCYFVYVTVPAYAATQYFIGPAPSNGSASYAGTAGDGILLFHTGMFTGTGAPASWVDTPRPNFAITDQSGSGNNGTLTGGAALNTNYGVTFTGTPGQYVSLPSGVAGFQAVSITVDVSSLVNGTAPAGPVIGNSTAGNFSLYYSPTSANAYDHTGRWAVKNGAAFETITADDCVGPLVNITAVNTSPFIRLFCNGREMQYQALNATTLNGTGTVQVGGDSFNSSYFTGSIWNVSFWSFSPTQSQVSAWAQFSVSDTASKGVNAITSTTISGLAPPGEFGVLTCFGDSITIGFGGSLNPFCSNSNASLTPSLSYSAYAFGVGGEAASTIVARLNPPNNWISSMFSTNSLAQQKVVVIYAGTNDITINGQTPATTASYIWQGVSLAKAAYPGVRVLVGSAISRSGGVDSSLNAFNLLLRNNWRVAGADGLLDFGALTHFAPNGANYANTAYYQGDGIHPTQTGHNVMAAALTTALNNLTSDPGPVSFGTPFSGTCHAQYAFSNDGGGAPGLITPLTNCIIPPNSTVKTASVWWTTAATGSGSSVSIGLAGAGGSSASILASTAASSLAGQIQSAVTSSASSWVHVTTAGGVTLTTSGAALTAGVCEITLTYETTAN
jgi:lysophospholipase L1-like esterase